MTDRPETQAEFNARWDREHPLEDYEDELLGMYTVPLTTAQKQHLREELHKEIQAQADIAIKRRLDAEANRSEFQWRRRSMRQRGSRY